MIHTMTYRVPYADTDRMGVVYHANYLVYFERSRTEMFRDGGLPYSELEQQGIIFPVVESGCRYLKSARYDDLLTFRSHVTAVGGVRIRIETEVLRGEELLVTGFVVLASVSLQMKVLRLPAAMVEIGKKFMEE